MKRDRGLDLLKGAACILMILAHGRVESNGHLLILGLKFLGQFAPVVFFGISGITAYLQSKRKDLLNMSVFYILLFILGFTYNGILVSDYWHVAEADILQCIALSTLIILGLSRVLSPRNFLWVAPIPFVVHLILQRSWLPHEFPLRSFIMPPGVFPLLPWLAFFLLGTACYFMGKKGCGITAGVLVILFVVSGQYDAAGDLANKWNMSIRFFLLACSGTAGALFMMKVFGKWLAFAPIEFLGKYSLLFLYCHYIPVFALEALHIVNPAVVWPAALGITVILMYLLLRLNRLLPRKWFEEPYFWVAVTTFVIVNPYLFRYKVTVKSLSLAVGILIALNYHTLNTVIVKIREKLQNKAGKAVSQ